MAQHEEGSAQGAHVSGTLRRLPCADGYPLVFVISSTHAPRLPAAAPVLAQRKPTEDEALKSKEEGGAAAADEGAAAGRTEKSMFHGKARATGIFRESAWASRSHRQRSPPRRQIHLCVAARLSPSLSFSLSFSGGARRPGQQLARGAQGQEEGERHVLPPEALDPHLARERAFSLGISSSPLDWSGSVCNAALFFSGCFSRG